MNLNSSVGQRAWWAMQVFYKDGGLLALELSQRGVQGERRDK